MSESYQYLTKKYIENNLIDKEGNHIIINKSLWNPFIYPDSGYIPSFEEYMKQYEMGTKVNELLWPHFRCGCLWSEYFQNKIKKVNENIKFKET
jgi:hypothetical protein